MHVHVYPHHFDISVVADGQELSSGITTMVDAGSAGPASYGRFHQAVVQRSKTRVLAFVNIVDAGMGGAFEQGCGAYEPRLDGRWQPRIQWWASRWRTTGRGSPGMPSMRRGIASIWA